MRGGAIFLYGDVIYSGGKKFRQALKSHAFQALVPLLFHLADSCPKVVTVSGLACLSSSAWVVVVNRPDVVAETLARALEGPAARGRSPWCVDGRPLPVSSRGAPVSRPLSLPEHQSYWIKAAVRPRFNSVTSLRTFSPNTFIP